MSYYWINTFNMAEVGGPHETKDAARRDCIAKYDKMNTVARAVVIAEVVEEGSVERTASWVAAGGRLDVDALNSLGSVRLTDRTVPRYPQAVGADNKAVYSEHVKRGPHFETEHGTFEVGELCTYTVNEVGGVKYTAKILDILQDGDASIDLGGYGTRLVKWRTLTKLYASEATAKVVDREYVIAGPGGSMYPKEMFSLDLNRKNWLHWPWYATKGQFLSAYVGRTEEAKKFYRTMGTDGYVLETVVEERDIPRELVDCYESAAGRYWLIRIDRVPPDLRDQFPRLRGDVHAVDYDRLPQWQRALYAYDEAVGKTVLRVTAWGRE